VPDLPEDAPVYTMAVTERLTGLTRRQVRYYESLGLLKPARSPGNRRLYSAADVRRLQEIARLRAEGLDLGAVARLVGSGRWAPGAAAAPGGPVAGPAPGAGVAMAAPATSRSAAAAAEVGLVAPGADRLGPFEDARTRLLGRGPAVALDRLHPSEAALLARRQNLSPRTREGKR